MAAGYAMDEREPDYSRDFQDEVALYQPEDGAGAAQYAWLAASVDFDREVQALSWQMRDEYQERLLGLAAEVQELRGLGNYDPSAFLAGERQAIMAKYRHEMSELERIANQAGVPYSGPISLEADLESALMYVEDELGYTFYD
ncbi:hypothetical protein HY546_03610 [archaeon]|nr:hypothetical protein [archaeon]